MPNQIYTHQQRAVTCRLYSHYYPTGTSYFLLQNLLNFSLAYLISMEYQGLSQCYASWVYLKQCSPFGVLPTPHTTGFTQ